MTLVQPANNRGAGFESGRSATGILSGLAAIIGAVVLVLWLLDDGVSLPATDETWRPDVVWQWDPESDSDPSNEDSTSNTPLGSPPDVSGGGVYEFIRTQNASDDPVTFDPCREIAVTVNLRTAPAGALEMTQRAITSVSQATGLQFSELEQTSRQASFGTAEMPPDGEWPRALIDWSDPDAVSELEGDTAGIGGASSVSMGDRFWYIDGMVALDGPQLIDVIESGAGVDAAVAIIKHELAHVVGLDHVDAEGELMQPVMVPGLTTWGPGDQTGLAALGSGQCMPNYG